MTDEAKALVDELLALYVWPQSVADNYADLLTPRQIEKLYEVGRVSHEAADLIETQAREIERLRGALKEIMDLPGEINPSNYDHVDVCELNRQFCLTYEIARAALGDSHDQ